MLSAKDIERAVRMFAVQRDYAVDAGVPTYVAILNGFIDDVRTGGPISPLLQNWDGTAEAAFSLRILGALHRLALDGRAPALARMFLTTGGRQDAEAVWPIARTTLEEHRDFIIAYTHSPPQTNEVARSAVLWSGFLHIAAQYRLPFRLREVGASAGLNLWWDQYRVDGPTFSWGPHGSPVRLTLNTEGPVPDAVPIAIVDRAACDASPIDIRKADDRARLESYIWPDQPHRLERLRSACDIARQNPFRLDQADAGDWLERELETLPQGQVTVVYYSIFRQYVSAATEAKLQAVIESASARATRDAPLAVLAFEMQGTTFPDLVLTTWPTGETRTLASAHYHGEWVKWRT
jgi:hypothetical protein